MGEQNSTCPAHDRAGRHEDLIAMTSPDMPAASVSPDNETCDVPGLTGEQFVDYSAWGVEFFHSAVTPERLINAVSQLAGRPIEMGPIGVGPGRIAKVRAAGKTGIPAVQQLPQAEVTYRLELPVELRFELDLGLQVQVFHAQLTVPLVLAARATSGLKIFIDITPPAPQEVKVQIQAEGFRASLTQRIANIEYELRRFVVKYVQREVNKPYILKARIIDVDRAIETAWASIAPKDTSKVVASDFGHALETELDRRPSGLLDL